MAIAPGPGRTRRLAPHGSDYLAVLLLCGQALELGLKAPLLATGWNSDQLIRKIGHDLVAAWNAALKAGAPLGDVPEWAVRLSQLHDSPFHVRFPAVNGHVSPNVEQLARDVANVVNVIETALREAEVAAQLTASDAV